MGVLFFSKLCGFIIMIIPMNKPSPALLHPQIVDSDTIPSPYETPPSNHGGFKG